MSERIAHGVVEIEVNDRDALARLHELEAQFKAAMDDIGRQKAKPEIDAEIAPFKDAVENCKREIKKFEGIKATAELDADKKQASAEIKKLKAELKDLEGQKAEVELKVKADTSQLAAAEARAAAAKKELEAYKKELVDTARKEQQIEKQRLDDINRRTRVVSALNKQRIREERAVENAERTSDAARLRAINNRARVSASLERQRAQAMAQMERDHASALKMERDRTVGVSNERLKIIQLQREYGKLTDVMERLHKRRAFTAESRVKLSLDRAGVMAEMEVIKAELNMLGSHPPVEIQVEMERRKSMSRVRRFFAGVADIGKSVMEKAANLGDLTARLGPFTATLKQFGLALAFLGPVILDLVGAAGALVSVVGAGLAGAATVGAGAVAGLGIAVGGFMFSIRNTGSEVKNARTAINAYQKAVQQYGKTSDQAKAKQQAMNNTLKSISPLARTVAQGIERFYTNWDKHTAETQKHLNNMARGGFKALNDITPMWARSTNRLSGVIDRSLQGAFKFLRSPEFANDFNTISDNFRRAMTPMMQGLGSFGRAFLNFAREGSKALEPMANGVKSLGDKLLAFTQRNTFGDTVQRWVGYARDLVHFFGAAGRVLVDFFARGVTAGDGLLKSMTSAMNRWDRWLRTAHGKTEISDGFQRAADGARALWGAIQPLLGLFIVWASNLTPVVTFITQIIGGMAKLGGGVTKLLGLLDGIPAVGTAIGMALGAAFAIGKIGALLEAISRVVAGLKEIRSLASAGSFIKNLPGIIKGTSGSGGIAGSMASAGAAAAAEIGGAMEAAGTAVAAEIGAAMSGGGAVGGAEGALGNLLGPNGKPIRAAEKGAMSTVAKEAESGAKSVGKFAAGAAAGEAAATGLGAAIGGVTLASAAAATGGLALAGAVAYFGAKAIFGKNANDKFKESLAQAQKLQGNSATAFKNLAQSATGVAIAQDQANQSVKQARAELKATKAGTDAHRTAMLNYRQAVIDSKTANDNWKNAVNDATTVAAKQIKGAYDAVHAFDKRYDGQLKQLKVEEKLATTEDARHRATDQVNQLMAKRAKLVDAQTQAENRAAATAANYARIYRGLVPLIGAAEQAVGRLARSAPKLAKTVAIKFTDQGDAKRVAQSAASALNSGVPKRVVTKIVADSKDADQALARLNNARVTPKRLLIAEQGGEAAVKILERIIGKKLTPKQQRIAEQGGPGVLAMLGRIIGRKIPDKSFLVRAIDRASGVVANVQSYLNSLHDKTITVAVKRSGHVGPLAYASGGPFGLPAPAPTAGTARAQDRALERVDRGVANRSTTSQLQRGGRIQGPRAIYGEEPQHPEFVISTNPSYRKSNVGFLRAAAAQLGVKMAALGADPGMGLLNASGIPQASFGTNVSGGAMMHVSKKKKKRITKANQKAGKKGKKLSLLNTNHPWLDRVNTLEEQQGLWEQEVSFREGNIEEPDDFLTETKDADGNTVGYAIDKDAVNAFVAQLQAVKDAYDALVQVITDLLTAIPNAHREAQAEIANRNFNIGQLETAVHQQRLLIKGLNKDNEKGKNNDEIKKAQERISRYTKQIDKEKAGRDLAKSAVGDLVDKNQSTVFDYREASRSRDSYIGQIAGMNLNDPGSKPNTQLADATASLGDGGGSGSGSGSDTVGLSYGEQAVAMDTEKASVLQQFGSNFNPNVGGFGAGAAAGAGAGQGMVNNPVSALGAAFQGTSVGAGALVSGTITSGARAASAMSPSPAPAVAQAAPSGGGGSTVVVNNTFATVPPDPHTWSQGVKFELAATI